MTGGNYSGDDGTGFVLSGGPGTGATFGTTEQRDAERARLQGIDARGFALSGDDMTGALYSGHLEHGALIGTGQSTPDELLARTDGFGLVVEPIPEPGKSPRRQLYVESPQPDADGTIDAISMPLEANAISGARIQLAAEPALYRFPLGDAVLGYAGNRLFSGRVEPVSANSDGESAGLELLGPLSRLDHGGVSVSYAGMTVRDALREFYTEEVTPRTNGRVRGIVETPGYDAAETRIPADAPLESSGTPLGVLDELHGTAGLTYATRHGARGDAIIESFAPGEAVPRDPTWEIPDSVTPTLDPGGHATDVLVEGAQKPGVGESSAENPERYQATASVTEREARAVTGGERITFRPEPDDALTSDAMCAEVAETLLAERRASFTMSGSVDAPPAPVQPGRVYRVPSMDRAAPAALSPVSLALQKVEYSFARGERAMTLSFESEQGIAGLLRRAGRGTRAAGRAVGGRGLGFGGDGPRAFAYARQYPHPYPGSPAPAGGYDRAYDRQYDGGNQ